MTVVFIRIDTEISPVNVAATDRGVVAIEMLTPPELFVSRLERRLRTSVDSSAKEMGGAGLAGDHLDQAVARLEAYFAGSPDPVDLPLDLDGLPGWDTAVFSGVRTISRGSVSSYGRVARRIGKPGAARAVGGAVGRNPVGIVIPCHRVIAGDGSIGGYGGAWWGGRDQLLEIKTRLLELEGVKLPVRRFPD
jgi:methylated-DNA-[protein]-cysteine S-methyltransferase